MDVQTVAREEDSRDYLAEFIAYLNDYMATLPAEKRVDTMEMRFETMAAEFVFREGGKIEYDKDGGLILNFAPGLSVGSPQTV